jgi:hypothetical protein
MKVKVWAEKMDSASGLTMRDITVGIRIFGHQMLFIFQVGHRKVR